MTTALSKLLSLKHLGLVMLSFTKLPCVYFSTFLKSPHDLLFLVEKRNKNVANAVNDLYARHFVHVIVCYKHIITSFIHVKIILSVKVKHY